MTLSYEVTLDDVTRFVQYVVRTNTGFKRNHLWALTLGFWIGAAYVKLTGPDDWIIAVVKFVAAMAIFSGFYVYFSRKQIADAVRRCYGQEGAPLGKKRLTVSEDGFEEVGDDATTAQKWAGIVNVQETADAIYLFNAPGSAYIVPKRSLDPGTIAEFMAVVSRARRRRQGEPSGD